MEKVEDIVTSNDFATKGYAEGVKELRGFCENNSRSVKLKSLVGR